VAVKKSKKPAKQIQRPDLRRHYRYQHTPLDLSNTDIRLLLVRSRQMPTVIDDLVESVNWTFSPESPVVTGNVAFIQDGFQTVHVSEGDLLICQYSVGDRWPEVWRMRLRNVKRDLSPTDSRQFELAEDLIAWAESTDNFHYGKSKARPHGWFAHEILIDVARRYRLPVGKVCRGSHRITGISGEMTPMEAVRRAYALERRATGKRFVIEWRYGKLNILPQKRGDDMLSLGPLIEGANISRQERDEKYANAVIIRGAVKGKDGKRKKVRGTEASAAPAVDETLRSARYYATQAHRVRGEIAYAAQGATVAQYLACVDALLPLMRPGVDWLAFGGFCIIGRVPSLKPLFYAVLDAALPRCRAAGITRAHLLGVTVADAITVAAGAERRYGVALSTDSTGPEQCAVFGRGYTADGRQTELGLRKQDKFITYHPRDLAHDNIRT